MSHMVGRRAVLSMLAGMGFLLRATESFAFGEESAFHARLLHMKEQPLEEELSGARRWASELTRRTSAPGRLSANRVAPKSRELLKEPFLVWTGRDDPGKLSGRAVRALRKYVRMGGILLIDDRSPSRGKFGQGARREMTRVLPESAVVRLDSDHVIFKTFYILERPVGRAAGSQHLEAIVRGKTAQVLFLDHDLLGALARTGEAWTNEMESGGEEARERAIRFAVNIAMYVLCSDYKDDQVHAPFLMRKRRKKK